MSATTLTTAPTAPTTATEPPEPATRAKDDGRIGLRAHLRHTGALAQRNVLAIRQDPQSILDAVLAPIILTLLFVFVFGGAIFPSRDAYVDYVVPGLMAMMGLNIAMAVGTGFNQDFETGVMDRFRSLPIARSSVLIAKIVVEIGRMLIATAILLAMGFALGLSVDSVGGLLAAIGLAVLFGSALMWIFLTMGVVMKNAQAIQSLGFLVLMPLQFGSSIFAPTDTMPDWLQTFTDYNPLSALADAARSLIGGNGASGHDLVVVLAWTAALTLVMAPVAIRKFQTRT
ncbi:ABC transporter permease [Streptomyces sp. NPDC059816]|uniref:ABC transporter permease n=1 Tax=Streptomyces sp. NPDC059816 TaxID=3346960 RepID=UPI003651020F